MRRQNVDADFELHTFYGQLQHIIAIHLPLTQPRLEKEAGTTLILADIRTCKTNDFTNTPLGTPSYEQYEPNQVFDMNNVQCLVGRLKFITTHGGRTFWAIVDRSSDDMRAVWVDEEGSGTTVNRRPVNE